MDSQSFVMLAVVLLGFPSSCCLGPTPRVSFLMGSPERLLTSFSSHDVGNTTTLLLSEDGETLFVGARNAVLALDVSHKDAIFLRSKLDWSPSDKDLEQCSMKGKDKEDCPNFIRVLQFLNASHIYACGTFAFSPRCTYIGAHVHQISWIPLPKRSNEDLLPQPVIMHRSASLPGAGGCKGAFHADTLTAGHTTDEGRGRCPYDPYQRNTAIIVDGELYTATVADYRGNRPVISRHLSEGSRVDLKLDDTLGWLEDPTFISSSFIPHDEKIYFFFSEVGREYNFMDKLIVSRVSQVCLSDVGGQRTLQRRWTTFAKAQLLCQADGELPYNVIQDMVVLPPAEGGPAEDTVFYGIFTSQWAVNSGRSAVCSFHLTDIKSVLSGNYKALNRDTLQWSTRVQEKIANPGECGLHNASDNALRFVKENFLAEDIVHPSGRRLTMVSVQHAYSHLTVQRVRAANKKLYTILFLLTEAGFLHKVVLLQPGFHIIEEVQVFEAPQPIKSLKLSVPKDVLYVGTSEAVLRVPLSNCSYYWTCAQCVLSRDPFCGWDPLSRTCTEVSGSQSALIQDVDGGDVEESCSSVSSTHRSRFGPNKLPSASCPAGELVSVSLNQVVRLLCPAASQLSRQLWERPNSRLSSDLYLQLEDGSLSFVATPATLGHYLCLSTENGYRQTMAIYQVKQKSSPVAQTPTGYTQTRAGPTTRPGPRTSEGSWPKVTESRRAETESSLSIRTTRVTTHKLSRNRTLWTAGSGPRGAEPPDGQSLLSPQYPSYLKELVVVCVLLVLCLSLLITMTLYVIRQRCRSRTAPQTGPLTRESDRTTPEEQEALRVNRHSVQAPNGEHSAGLVCNGSLSESRQHLPNTPI